MPHGVISKTTRVGRKHGQKSVVDSIGKTGETEQLRTGWLESLLQALELRAMASWLGPDPGHLELRE